MSTTEMNPRLTPTKKLVRECVRPWKQLSRKISKQKPHSQFIDGVDAMQRTPALANFDPQDCTVEPQGIKLIQTLVRESSAYRGPIIEVGTLLGITTTQMALAKKNGQRIIAVDNFCWNPWGLTPDVHHALAQQVLYYLTETGDVELIRMCKNEFFETYDGPAPSMVFLDAMHDYEETKKDIEWAKRIGAKIISGHDYCEKWPGVMAIVNEHGGPRQLGGTVWTI
jgi:hypothetical protein